MSKQVLLMPVPPGTLGAYAIGAESGAIAATLAADSPLFSFRWGDALNFAIINFISVSAVATAAITTAVATGLEIVPARVFTASDSGGTNLTPAGAANNDQKLKTNFATSLVTDIRIATTATLTAGTRTLDPFSIGQVLFGTGTTVGTTLLAHTILYDREVHDYPLVLSQDEGFIITNPIAGPATGTFQISVNVRWNEMTKQVF